MSRAGFPLYPLPPCGGGLGWGSDPRPRIMMKRRCIGCIVENTATPTPALPRQSAGLTARRGRGRKKLLKGGERGATPRAWHPAGERVGTHSGQPRRDRLSAEGLSAAVGDLHRPGDPRRWRRRGLDIRIVSLRHPTDRKPASDPPPRSARRCLPAGISLARAGPGASRLVAGAAAAGLSGRARPGCADLRRDPTSEPRPPLRPGAGAGGRVAAPTSGGCTPISCIRPPRCPLCRAHARASPGASRPMPRTSGRRPIGRSARSSPPAIGCVTCTAVGAAPSGARSRRRRQVDAGLSRPRSRPLSRHRQRPRRRRDGSDPRDPVVILSVGRAVEKKGYDDLLAALALLPADLAWRFVHIGGGPLRRNAQSAGREPRPCRAHRLARRAARRTRCWRPIASADLFVLASRDRPRRRPRRPAQRADGGAEPGAGLRRDPGSAPSRS